MNVVLAHHWAEQFRGGEAVLEQFALMFPNAPIASLYCEPSNLGKTLATRTFIQSCVSRNKLLRDNFRSLLPLFPVFNRTIGLPPAKLVLASDAALIKGVEVPSGAMLVCYCHSPPRYLWGLEQSYFTSRGWKNFAKKVALGGVTPFLRSYDFRHAQKVDHFIANSICVQERISKYYKRESTVIRPPVHIDRFNPNRTREDFYLVVSALVPYKRVDLAVKACSALGKKLIVIGTGSELSKIKVDAGPTVSFLGRQPDKVVADHYERCKAFLFPGLEDFGITPCEAQAAGAPVIAFGQGGALETVINGVSGLFFEKQSVESLSESLRVFEAMDRFPAMQCREAVMDLGPERFRSEIRNFMESIGQKLEYGL